MAVNINILYEEWNGCFHSKVSINKFESVYNLEQYFRLPKCEELIKLLKVMSSFKTIRKILGKNTVEQKNLVKEFFESLK